MKQNNPPSLCRIKGCGAPVALFKHQLCSAHYQRLRLGREVDAPIHRSRKLTFFKGAK